jgi:hypothetical protein
VSARPGAEPDPLAAPSEQAATRRLGGLGAVLAGAVFLSTIAYTFGFLAALGLTTDMLDAPAQLLPWVHAHGVAYAGLWWIYALHLLLLLPAPFALATVVARGARAHAATRAATAAALAGIAVGMAAAMVNAATAPALGRAAVGAAPGSLPGVLLLSDLAGSLGLHLRLVSDLLVAVWLGVTGALLARLSGWRALGRTQLAVAAVTLVVVIAKPFDWIDGEPFLGLLLAIVYLWLGVRLLRAAPVRS